MKKALLFVFAAFALTAVLVSYNGCSKKPVKPPVIAVTGVSLNKTTISLTVGAKETLVATVAPTNATNKIVTWSSDNIAIATVNSSTGEVTAVAAGAAKINAVSGGKVATCFVTVPAVPVAVVSLNKTTTSITIGAKETLTVTITPTNATNKTVTWTSDNLAVATVNSSTGEVSAVSSGVAKITATSNNGKTASCTVTINVNIETVIIPPGTFKMGSPIDEDFRQTDETQHNVTLTKGFRMGKYEVTNAQYATFLNFHAIGVTGTGVNTCAQADSGHILIYDSATRGGNLHNWGVTWSSGTNRWMAVGGYENHPVINVTYAGATLFAVWVGGSLPTEAQWEYACRAGTTNTFFWPSMRRDEYVWYSDNSGGTTHKVGQKLPNGFGLYDIQGNVSEWCLDRWNGGPYGATAVTDPVGISGNFYVYRGGYYGSIYYDLRSADRMGDSLILGYHNIGFRVVFDL
jgi:Uncharacterized conserved protein